MLKEKSEITGSEDVTSAVMVFANAIDVFAVRRRKVVCDEAPATL